MNVISPTWFKLSDNEGNFTSFATSGYVSQAHNMGLEVWGLVDDFSYDVDVYAVLSSTTKRNNLVRGLVQAALDCGMGYDEHWHGSKDVGSVASINYVRNGIEKMLEEVPSHKVINAVPFYTILWKTTGTEVTDDYVTMVNQRSMLDSMGMQTIWDEEACQNYGELAGSETTYQIWLEDPESIQVKLNVMNNYDLGGVAVWRLGYEDPAVWELISAYAAGGASGQ